jgi:hypothetical protein
MLSNMRRQLFHRRPSLLARLSDPVIQLEALPAVPHPQSFQILSVQIVNAQIDLLHPREQALLD